MDYTELEKKCVKAICIWGYGVYGKTYAYLSLRCAGAKILGYCDRKYVGDSSFNGIPLISKEELVGKYKDAFVFIAIKDLEQQQLVLEELKKQGIECEVFDQSSFSNLCESIINSNDELVLRKYSDIVDDELFLRYIYQFKTGNELNIEEPSTYNEKIQWLKLYNRDERYTKYVDKYEVKSIVSKAIGEEHIIPTFGIWDCVEMIDFDNLPEKFVLKCTHDSGSAIICSSKESFCISEAKAKLNKAIKTNYYWLTREFPYKNVHPRIIAETKLESGYEDELKDYKVFAFNGEPKIIQVDYNRHSNHTRAMYSQDWEYLGFSTEYPLHETIEPKPEKLSEILDLAKKLAVGIPHVRVDFYIVNKEVYFGEMTFYHGSGYELFSDEDWNIRLGKYIDFC